MQKKYKIGLTFGVFDLFHIGHLNILKHAKRQCNKLIVCVSNDSYCHHHKGKIPVFSYQERMDIVSSIKYVDVVSTQSLSFGKKQAIKKYQPDVLFVGSDWNKDTYTGEGLGVPVVYLPHTDGISSTIIRKKLEKSI